MFIIKYSFINIIKNIKLHIPLFVITAFALFALMSVFTVHNNVLSAKEEQFGEYAVVAISSKGGTHTQPTVITNEWVERHALSELTIDHYAFNEFWAGSETLSPILSSAADIWGLPFEVPFGGTMPLTLLAYSDINKSTHFKFGDRRIVDGRFAQNTNECNISAELAELNSLSIGDTIEIYLYYHNPDFFSFEIVGIYEDNTEKISNELPLVTSRIIDKSIHGEIYNTKSTTVSQDSINLNQILTAAPSSIDLTALAVMNLDLGYRTAVFYVHDEKSILAYIEEINDILPDDLMTYDSADMMRYVHHVLDRTSNSFHWLLAITYIINVIFCTLIIFYILKDRTYDIGVYRAKGMSLTKVAFTLTSEIIIVSVLSFLAAGILYITTFIYVSNAMYYLQDTFTSNDSSFWLDFSAEVMHAARGYEFSATVGFVELIYGFLATIAHIIIVGFATTLFISRHEPMKTMTKV